MLNEGVASIKGAWLSCWVRIGSGNCVFHTLLPLVRPLRNIFMKGTLAIMANGRRSWLSRFWGPGTDINERTQQNLALGKRYINKTICHSSESFYMGSPMNKEKSNTIRIILKESEPREAR